MATLTALKKKIAALEAQVERVTKAELDNAIAKIRKLMSDYGVTLEHLADERKAPRSTKKATGAKATKGARPPKYQDPKTGATWSGLGRIPAWIAKAKDRAAFLIGGAGAEGAGATTAKHAATRKARKRTASAAAPTRGKKAAAAKKAVSTKKSASAKGAPTTKRASAKQPAVKKPAVRKGRQAPKVAVESASVSAPQTSGDASSK